MAALMYNDWYISTNMQSLPSRHSYAHKITSNLVQGLDDGVGVLVGLGLATKITSDVL